LRANKSKSLYSLSLLLFLLANSTSGANHTILNSAFLDGDQPGSTAADFLKIGIGAKARGMGGAFVGLADDPSAIYWNPAGLSQLDCPQVMFVHDRWAQDIRYEYIGCAIPVDPRNTVAVAVTFLHMGEILGYDENDKPTSFFSAYDATMLLGYSRRISSGLSLGWTAKAILEKLENEKAQAAAFDIGLFYDSHKVLNKHLLLSTDADFLADTPPGFRQGMEYNIRDILFTRGGIEYEAPHGSSPRTTSTALGGGIRISEFQFDYTYSSVKSLGNLHNFSLVYRFASE
jgi:hypothetical protein